MDKRTDLDDKPTRKRPLQIQVGDDQGELVIVLIGPHNRMRNCLFERLGRGPGRGPADHRFRAGTFELGGVTIDLIDWHSSNDPIESLGALGKASYALCIDPDETHDDEALGLFLEPLKEGLFSNACIALVSASGHLGAAIERAWSQRLAEAGARCPIFRVNCADSMSPELFAKLFLAGVRDGGGDDYGIVVEEGDR